MIKPHRTYESRIKAQSRADCLDTYGTALGTWHFDATKITFTPPEEKDVLPYKRDLVFVPPKDRKYFKK
jgi:hypothetical protein